MQKNENEIKIIVNVQGCIKRRWTFLRMEILSESSLHNLIKCNQWEQQKLRKDTRINGNRTS